MDMPDRGEFALAVGSPPDRLRRQITGPFMSLKRTVSAYGLAVAGLAALTLGQIPLQDYLTFANSAMLYLLLVFIVGVSLGTGPASLSAFLSFASINFFFVQPRYTFFVADPREVLDLVVFVTVGAIAGRLGANVRGERQLAQQRAQEQSILYHLVRILNQLTTQADIRQALIRFMEHELGAISAEILSTTSPPLAPDALAHYLLIQAGEKVYGTLRLILGESPNPPQLALLETCAVQVGMALQRIELAEQASKSQQFEEADRLKTTLLRAVSHDLRTPITIIKTSASNLREFGSTLPPQERSEIAQTIEVEADQLDELVGNLLDLSRLEAGALKLNAALNSLEEIAGDVAARVWQLQKQERIKITFPDSMPLVAFDYGLMLQALANLVDNTLRYEPPDSMVEIRGEIVPPNALLKVINHGETIPDEVKKQLMQPFYRGQGGRVGLGLPIAQGIVRAHHGTLRVEDTPGSGATFVIELPLKEELGR